MQWPGLKNVVKMLGAFSVEVTQIAQMTIKVYSV